MRRWWLVVVLALCCAGCAPLPWWTFRADDAGRASNPSETAITAQNVGRLHQVWHVDNPAYSQPNVPLSAGGVVFLVEQSQASDSGTVTAVDLLTGARRWSRTYPHRLLSYGLVSGNVLLGYDDLGHTSGVLAVSQGSGRQVWQAKADPGTYPAAGAVSGDGRIYAPFAGYLYALDPVTGRRLWRYACADPLCEGDPTAGVAFANHRVFIGGNSGWAGVALDASTGRQVTAFSGPIAEWFGQPLVSGNEVLFPGQNSTIRGAAAGQVAAFSASGCGAAVCKPRWFVSLDQPVGRLAAQGTTVYARGMYENVDALDLATGNRTWHGSLPPVGTGSAINNVAVAGNVVYATSGSSVYAFPTAGCGSASSCAPIWAPRLGDGTYILAQWNGPVVTGGRLLYVDQNGLHAYAVS